MTDALINWKIVQWAIKRNRETLDVLACKLSVKPESLKSWETGQSHPSLSQAQDLAQKLRIPLGYLFLTVPPVDSLPLPDLRTKPGATPLKPSPEFLDVIYDALRKQDWYREHQLIEGKEPVPFIGKYGLNDSVNKIAADIQTTIGINENMRRKVSNWEQFLEEFIHQTEAKGILVLRQGIVGNNTARKLKVREFRGFAAIDNIAPLIFINDQDVKVAKIFTLAHELAHLWVGKSGVSNLNYTRRSSEQIGEIDRFCDHVAAEVLTPADDFKSYWGLQPSIEQNVNYLVRRYRVSRFVILRRAYDLELIPYKDYKKYYQTYWDDIQRPKGDGGNFDSSFLYRNSRTFTFTLLDSASEGKISQLEASRLLNVKLKSLVNIESRLLFTGLNKNA